MINNLSSNYANTVAPFAPLGRQVVGQESADLKSSTFKALEQSADSARSENRRSPDDRPNEQGEEQRVRGGSSAQASGRQDKSASEKDRVEKEQKQINELAAVDREVRAHEQAHAAVAGQYAGTTTYSFVKGPDGVSYAVGGEVSISTGAIPNDPEATLRKAQQIRQAANAPADPSPQDRRVAAEAAQLENEARSQLREKEAAEAEQQTKQSDEKIKVQKADEEQKATADETARKEAKREQEKQEEELARRSSERLDIFARTGKNNIDINRRLVEIGVASGSSAVGTFLNQEV